MKKQPIYLIDGAYEIHLKNFIFKILQLYVISWKVVMVFFLKWNKTHSMCYIMS